MGCAWSVGVGDSQLPKPGHGLLALALGLGALFGSLGPVKAALPQHPRETGQSLAAQSNVMPSNIMPSGVIKLTRVQLGAWRTAIEAAKGWDRIEKRAAGSMEGLSPRVVPANLPGRGTFYRLWVGPVLKASAGRFCAKLKTHHIDCVPAPNDAPGAVPRPGVYQASEHP
jgi:hypothetical protein